MNELRKRRLTMRMQQCELAKESGVSISHISRLENEWIKGTYLTGIKLADVLNCNVEDIFPELSEVDHAVSR